MSKLVLLNDLKKFLAIDLADTSYDDILNLLNELVGDEVEKYIGTAHLTQTDIEEVILGNGSKFLFLSSFPITQINSVQDEDGVSVNFIALENVGVLIIDDEDYGDKWVKNKKYSVSYSAGYQFDEQTGANAVPKSIQFVALKAIARQWNVYRSQGWGLRERSVAGGDSIAVQQGEILIDDEKEVLKQFRRISL